MKIISLITLMFVRISEYDFNKLSGPKWTISRIINGEDAAIQEYPFMLSLIIFPKSPVHVPVHVCGAAIIRKYWAVTAAHCVDIMRTYLYYDYAIRGNTTYGDQRNLWYIYHAIDTYYIHEKYDPMHPFTYDIALIKVKEPFFGLFEKPIAVVGKNNMYREDLPVYVLGWGVTLADNLKTSPELQKANLYIMNHKICKFLFSISIRKKHIKSQHICVGGVKYTSPCYGDSGGPLIQNGKLIGVASFAAGSCADNLLPVIYVNLAEFHDWVMKRIDAERNRYYFKIKENT